MLISDYVSSNIIICLCFYHLTHFRELWQKYKIIFVWFLVQMKTLNFAFEIYWPLEINYVRAYCPNAYCGSEPRESKQDRIEEHTCRQVLSPLDSFVVFQVLVFRVNVAEEANSNTRSGKSSHSSDDFPRPRS